MIETRAASRYAKSLIGLAIEKGVLEQVHEDMQFFTRVCEENRAFLLALSSPVVNHQKKLAILNGIFKTRVSPITFSIFDIITKKNREAILFDIAREFHNQYNQYKNVQPAQVTTTFPLDEKLRSEFKQKVIESTGKQEVELEEKVDPKLIGGYVLKIGDRQIDESIKSRLQLIDRKSVV